MRKIFNYLIVFLIFIGIELVDVNAKSFDCECTSIDPDHHFSLTFHVDSNDLVAKDFYPSYVFGGNGGSLYNTTLSSCADTPGRCDYNNKYNYKILNFNKTDVAILAASVLFILLPYHFSLSPLPCRSSNQNSSHFP